MRIRLKIDKYTIILLSILLVSSFLRLYQLDRVGYTTDEPIIITSGIKHFLNNPYSVSLYDMATPGGQWPIGLFVTLLSGRDFSIIRDYPQMDYASIDVNSYILRGLEFYARLPSAIAGILSSVLIYLLVKEMYGRKAGIISCALFSFSPIILDYSRIALLEIFQIFYMLAALYFFYLAMIRKNNGNTLFIISGVFLGLTGAAKLNGLMLIPLLAIFSIVSNITVKSKKNLVSVDLIGSLKNIAIISITSLIVLGFVFGFDLSVPLTVFNYYSSAGGAGQQFVLFNLLIDSIFYINPFFWILLLASLYLINKDKKSIKFNDSFAVFLLIIILVSGFFEAHESMKRGVQYVLLLFIVGARVFSDNNASSAKSKYFTYIAAFIAVSNLALIMYYFPNTALAKNIFCTSQSCLDAHQTLGNYDSRVAGEYINGLLNPVVFDTVATTGLAGFYLDSPENYFTGGLAKLINNGECPTFEMIKSAGFDYVIDNDGCFSSIESEITNCPYNVIKVKNYEMAKVYSLREC